MRVKLQMSTTWTDVLDPSLYYFVAKLKTLFANVQEKQIKQSSWILSKKGSPKASKYLLATELYAMQPESDSTFVHILGQYTTYS